MNRQVLTIRFRELLEPAQAWYLSREPREQLVIRLLAVLVALSLAWLLIWQPLHSGRDQARRQWIEAEQTRNWIEENREAVRQARSRAAGDDSGEDWIGGLNARAAEYQVSLKGYTPEGNNRVRVLLEDQSFSNVMVWLQALQNEAGVSASSLEISEGSREGSVNIRATLERGV